jgi:hypothetical protein
MTTTEPAPPDSADTGSVGTTNGPALTGIRNGVTHRAMSVKAAKQEASQTAESSAATPAAWRSEEIEAQALDELQGDLFDELFARSLEHPRLTMPPQQADDLRVAGPPKLRTQIRDIARAAAREYQRLLEARLAQSEALRRMQNWPMRNEDFIRWTATALAVLAPVSLAVSWATGGDQGWLLTAVLSLVAAAGGGALWWYAERQWQSDSRRAPYEHAKRVVDRAEVEWRGAVVEAGFLPLLRERLSGGRSLQTVLPLIDPVGLGDITDVTQFVSNAASEQLDRLIHTTSTASIGLSGPRGAGKTTLIRIFADPRLTGESKDLRVMVSSPTSYDPREFVIHLFTAVCKLVDPQPAPWQLNPRLARRAAAWNRLLMGYAIAAAGIAIFGISFARNQIHSIAPWLSAWTAVGLVLGAAGLWLVASMIIRISESGRSRPFEDEIVLEARGHLRELRYLQTRTRGWTGGLKLPGGVEVGRSGSRALAEQAKTYPELVAEFRDFLGRVGLDRRASDSDSKIIIGIDEVDKIGSAEDAERFLNDLKAVFSADNCYYLVSVSEDALTSYERRALAVRTTFDSAFDEVIRVPPFGVDSAQRLLTRRVGQPPEPFVALCHCLSGGLPRDLIRTTRALLDLRATRSIEQLPELADVLVTNDLRAVANGQLNRASQVSGAAAREVVRWIADAAAAGTAQLEQSAVSYPAVTPDADQLSSIVVQYSAYLYYAATLRRMFCDEWEATVRRMTHTQAAENTAINLLARARLNLAVDPGLAWRDVEVCRADRMPILPRPTAPAPAAPPSPQPPRKAV